MMLERIEAFLSQSRPQLWAQMSTQDKQTLADRIAATAAELEANPPWPRPQTTDHTELTAYHSQVRSWAQETALDQELYQVWPTDPEQEESDVDPRVAAALELQQELASDRQQAIRDLDR
ncbi:hypothetical protein CGZ98_06175 [Enemella evansiae]|nr:hypothetical protein CGZ98_06175 [Enemella evansiae]